MGLISCKTVPWMYPNNRFYHVLVKSNGSRFAVAVPNLQGQPDVLNKGHKTIVPFLLFSLIFAIDYTLLSGVSMLSGPLFRCCALFRALCKNGTEQIPRKSKKNALKSYDFKAFSCNRWSKSIFAFRHLQRSFLKLLPYLLLDMFLDIFNRR